jgi:hypothetical protein
MNLMFYYHSTSPATVAGNQIWLPGWLEAINSGKMIYSKNWSW